MHGSLDKPGKNDSSIYQGGGIGFLALPAIVAIALVGLAIVRPSVSNWVSEAVQAEVAGFIAMPEIAPTQLALPAMQIRTVRAN